MRKFDQIRGTRIRRWVCRNSLRGALRNHNWLRGLEDNYYAKLALRPFRGWWAVARAAAEGLTDIAIPFFIQHTFILLAPALFSAAMCMTLGKMVRHLKGQRHSIIPVSWLTAIFVSGDAVSFCIQGSGAGVVAARHSTMATGQKIIAGGISLQMVMFGLHSHCDCLSHRAAELAVWAIATTRLNMEAVHEGA
ncbi:RTA1 like, partial [Fusarium albosuccineum]